MFDADVLIVGGGPAGLVAAIAARRKGFRVMVADPSRPPLDKACGEGLMPVALAVADRLGIELPQGAGFPFPKAPVSPSAAPRCIRCSRIRPRRTA
jgi:flavin-dependent dehydrogenase